MAGLLDRLKSARDVLTSKGQDAPIVVDGEVDESDQDNNTSGDTGPLRVIRPIRPAGGQGGAAVSHFEKQRAVIDSFDEDYADRWDKVKLLAAKIVAVVLPVIAVLAIGDELGKYFSRFAGGTGSQTLIAYAGEAALAALTYILGSIFGRSEKSAAHYIKLSITLVIWLAFILASAWGQWAVAESALPTNAPQGLVVAIWLRISMACMLDAASVAIMFWRGKSLTKHLAQLQQKADATIRVNEAELAIERAQSAAETRRKEDELYLKGKEQAQNVVMRVQELQGEALIEQARNALQLPEGGQGGRKLRGGNGW